MNLTEFTTAIHKIADQPGPDDLGLEVGAMMRLALEFLKQDDLPARPIDA